MKAGLRYGFEKQPPMRTLMIQIREWVGDSVHEFSQLLTSHNFPLLPTSEFSQLSQLCHLSC